MTKRACLTIFLAVLLLASAAALFFLPVKSSPPTEPMLYFVVEPDVANACLHVQAAFDLAMVPAFKSPYLTDYNQLQGAELTVDGAVKKITWARRGDAVSFKGLPRKGRAVLNYTLYCVTEPRPGYRKRLMSGADFVMAYAGVYLAIPGREGDMVDVSWRLPDGWTLGLGWQGRRTWRETQDTIWMAGCFAHASLVEVDERSLSLNILPGVSPEVQSRISGMIEALFRHAWQTCGPLPEADCGVAVLPDGSIGGGASLAFSLAAEENMETVAHEMLHWWTNHKAPAWFREGVHTYITVAMLRRLGCLSDAEFTGFIQTCLREHERTVRDEGGLSTLAASSEAYDKGKGGGDMYGLMPLLAYRLDVEIRKQSGGSACLEDVFARVGRERTRRYNLLALIEDVTGYDPRPFFARYFYEKVTDVEDLLAPCGQDTP